MKKEIVAAALLAALFAGVIINIRVSEKLALELTDEINAAYESLLLGEAELSRSQTNAAIEHWLELDWYTHIFIRHSEINSTTEAFFQFKTDVFSGDADAAAGSYGLLKETLRSLMTMEQISIGSIF